MWQDRRSGGYTFCGILIFPPHPCTRVVQGALEKPVCEASWRCPWAGPDLLQDAGREIQGRVATRSVSPGYCIQPNSCKLEEPRRPRDKWGGPSGAESRAIPEQELNALHLASVSVCARRRYRGACRTPSLRGPQNTQIEVTFSFPLKGQKYHIKCLIC